MRAEPIIGLDEIDGALADAKPDLSEREQRLAVALYRLLATGEPVSVEAVAAVAGMVVDDAERAIRSWPAVYRDHGHRVIGFGGLSLQPMPHRLGVAGVDLFAWCAWDPLFLALIVGDIEVSTNDPVTGDAISYRIGAEARITDLSHPDSVLSFLRCDQSWDDDVMAKFCHFVLHFVGPESAGRWTTQHPGTFAISLPDAVELARRHVARTFGTACAPAH